MTLLLALVILLLPEAFTSEYIEAKLLSEGIVYKSIEWEYLKKGKIAAAGKSKVEWKNYLTHIELLRESLFYQLNPEIVRELEKIRFKIRGIGRKDKWLVKLIKKSKSIKPWDDISDIENLKMEIDLSFDISVSPSSYRLNKLYLMAIWDIFGTFASRETRLIDRNKFRKDTERLVKDKAMAKYYQIKYLKVLWGFTRGYKYRLSLVKQFFKSDIGEDGTIPVLLSTRFVSLFIVLLQDPYIMPEYIKRHYRSFIKNLPVSEIKKFIRKNRKYPHVSLKDFETKNR